MKTIDCNILDAPADVIAHCCNCRNTMGSGVARAIRSKYPEVYAADTRAWKEGRVGVGTISLAKILSPDNQIKYCFNLYGQDNYGREKRQVNYEGIYCALSAMKKVMVEKGIPLGLKTVAFPYKMCCALAGGDWTIIEVMIASVFGDSGLEVIICRHDQPVVQQEWTTKITN